MTGTRKHQVILFCFIFGWLTASSPIEAFSLFPGKKHTNRYEALRDKFLGFQKSMPQDRVYLMLDKPFYYPGETLWFQAYLRDGGRMDPSRVSGILHVEWIAPSGNKAKTLSLIVRNGVASGDISLDEDLPGGLYTLKAYTEWQKNSPEPAFFEKTVPIQRLILPELKMTVDFFRKAYGKGDDVTLGLKVMTRENKPLDKQSFSADMMLAGKTVSKMKGTTNGNGDAIVRFRLPDDLSTADGIVVIKIPYEGKTESISRAIPILLSRLDVGIYPEGGDLVAGLPSRVAVKAVDEFGKPADITASVIDESGRRVTEFKTFHQGMGTFRFTPSKGRHYKVKIEKPAGINATYPVPDSLERGYTLEIPELPGKTIDLVVRSTEKEELTLIAQCRGAAVQGCSFMADKGVNRVSLKADEFPMGVCQITLFDSQGIERAERLCFVNPEKQLNVSIHTDKDRYLPREKVSMMIRAADTRGIPVPAQLSLSVADDGLITFADDKSGTILSGLLLEPDLKGKVFEPSYYFDPAKKNRKEALDLLMLTQGWRRFTWKAILADTPPAIGFAAEKAEIRGVVLAGSGRPNPVSGAKITVESTGKTVISNDKGEFVIPDLDLYSVETLTASKGDQTGSPILVYDYKNPITLYLSPIYYEKGVGVMLKKAPRNRVLADDMMEGAARPDMEMPPMPVPAAIPEPAPDVKPVIKDAPMMMEMMDPRFMGKINRLGPPRPLRGPDYYRARVFPSPVYTNTEEPAERSDFRSTLFFKGLVETDRRGEAHVEFYNSDAVGSFRATVEGVGANGLVGRSEHRHYTQLPFSLNVTVPLEVSMGDTVNIPVTLTNKTGKAITGKLDITVPEFLTPTGDPNRTVTVEKGGTTLLHLPFKVLDKPGKGTFKAVFAAGAVRDVLVREMRAVPRGFPVTLGISSENRDHTASFSIDKPVPGSLSVSFSAYPTVLSDMLKGIESILQEPYGCFEQTSSSTYPNIMVLDYLNTQKDPDPGVMKKAGDLIGKGYNRLVSFETKEKGYEWFGENPGHEALTSYGLMEFKDMEKVFPGVDTAMVKRTSEWLLSRRDGKGGFLRNEKALDSFGRASDAITNAYIVYALSEAGFIHEIRKELDKATATALSENDPYQLALVANALFNVNDPQKGPVLKKLLGHQNPDGSWIGKTCSVTCSTGRGLSVETTSLAVLAILKSETREPKVIEKGVRFIVGARSAYGGFGNTQSTVLALKALSAFARYARRTAEPGTIVIDVNGRKAGEVSYKAGAQGEITIPASVLTPFFSRGACKVRIRFVDVKNPLPYTLSVTYNTLTPVSSKDCALSLKTALSAESVKAGGTVRLNATLVNTMKDKGQPMSLAIIGIPGGLSLQPWQLKDLQDRKLVDYYEVLGNNLVLYYRQMKPGEIRYVALDLKAEVPGSYEAQASSAYLYYTAEHKTWVEGERVRITE